MTQLVLLGAELAVAILEALGILVILVACLCGLVQGAIRLPRGEGRSELFHGVRNFLSRGILLGLELLVAADIIRTVIIELTFQAVGILALVVALRTFLSMTLELEATGRWPWNRHRPPTEPR